MMSDTEPQEVLSPQQIRVVACLMEKHLATPNNYPLTLNSLTSACNQKSNRDPVMNLSQGEVGNIAKQLIDLEYARINYGDRTDKYSHLGPGAFKINRQQQAILCMLMLRAPMTLNDIKARTERMVEFDSTEDIRLWLEKMIERPEPIVMLIPRGVGRREDRYTHLLAGKPSDEMIAAASQATTSSKSSSSQYQQQIDALEARVAKLERSLGLDNE